MIVCYITGIFIFATIVGKLNSPMETFLFLENLY